MDVTYSLFESVIGSQNLYLTYQYRFIKALNIYGSLLLTTFYSQKTSKCFDYCCLLSSQYLHILTSS